MARRPSGGEAPENLISPSRPEIKREALTDCLGRMAAEAAGAGH